MNLILFNENEDLGFLPNDDPRTIHIKSIIKPEINDTLDMGILNGLKGKMTITGFEDGLYFTHNLYQESTELHPITMIIGTPRPPVAKRLLKDLATAGIGKIIMCATDLGEKTYLTSKLWKDEKYMEYIYDGCSQSENTRVPEIERFFSLKKAIESVSENFDRLALDNISPDFKISEYRPTNDKCVVCIGGERGFSDREREMLKAYDFKIFSIGDRVLRTETACHHVLGSLLTIKSII